MGAPGGAIYLGKVFGDIVKDFGYVAQRMGHVPVRGPDAVGLETFRGIIR